MKNEKWPFYSPKRDQPLLEKSSFSGEEMAKDSSIDFKIIWLESKRV